MFNFPKSKQVRKVNEKEGVHGMGVHSHQIGCSVAFDETMTIVYFTNSQHDIIGFYYQTVESRI